MNHLPGFVAGLAAGFAHATMLKRQTARPSAWTPLLGFLRLGVVATVLLIAALNQRILAAASGWALCFAVALGIHAYGRSKQSTPSRESNSESKDVTCN